MAQTRVILLPGMDGTGELFRPLVGVMASSMSARVVSYPQTGRQSYETLLPFVEDELRHERAVVLVAESFSGPLALRYAAANAESVRAVVLCASFVCSPLPRWLRHVVLPLWFRVPPPAMAVRRFMVGPDASDALVRSVRSAVRGVPPAVLADRLAAVLGVDCSADLQRCRAPVLYLAAGRDALVRRGASEAVRAARPDVTLRTVTAPHLLLQAAPEAAWREIERFLGENGIRPDRVEQEPAERASEDGNMSAI